MLELGDRPTTHCGQLMSLADNHALFKILSSKKKKKNSKMVLFFWVDNKILLKKRTVRPPSRYYNH